MIAFFSQSGFGLFGFVQKIDFCVFVLKRPRSSRAGNIFRARV
jgi:hypothetical protein